MKAENLIFIISVLVAAIVLGGVFYYVKAEDSTNTMDTTSNNTNTDSNTPTPTSSFTELGKVDTVVGTGAEAVPGKTLKVNYTGKLLDGTVFDTSLKDGREPFEFTLGGGQVIQGWDLGFAGMKVGGKRTLNIPYSLGYGAQGSGPIKPYSDLIFEVELLEVK